MTLGPACWCLLVGDVEIQGPAEHVPASRRIAEKRKAISTTMRVELLDALRTPDHNAEVRTKIVRGAGICSSAGCDLAGGRMMEGALHSIPHR
jgi:hypothetical protein